MDWKQAESGGRKPNDDEERVKGRGESVGGRGWRRRRRGEEEGGKNANDARTLGKVSSYGDGEKQWIEVIAGPE